MAEFEAATADLRSESLPPTRGRARRLAWVVAAVVTAMIGIAVAGGDDTGRPTTAPPLDSSVDFAEQSAAHLIDRARTERWAEACGESQALEDRAVEGPDQGFSFPASPWPGGTESVHVSDAWFSDVEAAPLRAAALEHGATRATARTYLPAGGPGGVTIRIFEFPGRDVARAAARAYLNAAVCVFGAGPIDLAGSAGLPAMTSNGAATAVWIEGSRMIQATASGFVDPDAAVVTLERIA